LRNFNVFVNLTDILCKQRNAQNVDFVVAADSRR